MANPTKQGPSALDEALVRATADDALAAIERAGSRAQELVESWVRAGNAPAIAVVAERGSGPSRKAARRGAQVLGARGIKVEAAPRVTKLASEAADAVTTEAWLVPPDPNGVVLVVISTRKTTSRALSGFFYLRTGFGIEEASVGELSGSKLKEALRRAASIGLEPVSISPAYARQRVVEERRRLAELKLPEPLSMMSAEELLTPLPDSPEPHPFDVEGLELGDEDAAELAKKSSLLHQLPEFRSWLPDRHVVNELLANLGTELGPDGTKDQEKVTRVMTEAIRAATDRYFTPERRAGMLALMKDSALGVLNSHGEVRALEVVATMKAIEASGLITNPPHEVPFLRAFFEKAVLTLAMQNGGRLSVPVSEAPPAAV